MSQSLRAIHLQDGDTPSRTREASLAGQDASPKPGQPASMRTKSGASAGAEVASLWIEEPMRFHRARYEHLTHILHGKFNQASALLSCMILSVLGWRAGGGEHVSPERWLCGLMSGWFIVAMARLALFTCLAAPRGICYAQGRLRISGLGILRTGQVLHWSIQHGVRISAHAQPGVRVQICCRWCGCERHWMMLMEEGPDIERLQQVLEMHQPCSPQAANTAAMHRMIQIEAGVLSQ